MTDDIDFVLDPVDPSIIMVAGVGGGGGNAVNHMFDLGIGGVTFMVCNTDRQALLSSPVPIKVRLGEKLTEGLGAGSNPDRGREAAIESLDEIVSIFKREGTKMVFITAGMGGGTGTGAAPIIAKAAKELGILTVGIVTMPFKNEGKRTAENARLGISTLRKEVDSLVVINNQKIADIYGELPYSIAYNKADDVLASSAKGISEIITLTGRVNIDFADVTKVMHNSGVALIGTGRAGGENRAQAVIDMSLSSPLLNHNFVTGAKDVLLHVTHGSDEIRMDELDFIRESIQEKSGNEANILWGAGYNPTLDQDIQLTLIATGYDVEYNDAILNGDYNYVGSAINPVETEKILTSATEHRPNITDPMGGGVTIFAGEVIELETNNIYSNLEEIMAVPAFTRRKVQFVRDGADAGTKSSKVTLKEESSATKEVNQSGNLFE